MQGSASWRRPHGPELTPRDITILAWIGRHGIVTAEQIARKFFTSLWSTYRRLRKLEQLGLMRRDPTHWKEPFVLRLTPAGARVAAVGLAAAEVVLAEVHHALALVDLTEGLLVAHPDAEVTTEREIRAARYRARRVGDEVPAGRIPDALLRLSTGEQVAIELDITTKATRDAIKVVQAYQTRCILGDLSALWWYVLPGAAGRIRALVAEYEADDCIKVLEWCYDR